MPPKRQNLQQNAPDSGFDDYLKRLKQAERALDKASQ